MLIALSDGTRGLAAISPTGNKFAQIIDAQLWHVDWGDQASVLRSFIRKLQGTDDPGDWSGVGLGIGQEECGPDFDVLVGGACNANVIAQ